MVPEVMLNATKLALRISTDAFDSEILALLQAALLDLGVAGVSIPGCYDMLVQQACITYVKIHFGQTYDRGEAMARGYDLKSSYDEQKAQLATCTGYTDWLVDK